MPRIELLADMETYQSLNLPLLKFMFKQSRVLTKDLFFKEEPNDELDLVWMQSYICKELAISPFALHYFFSQIFLFKGRAQLVSALE